MIVLAKIGGRSVDEAGNDTTHVAAAGGFMPDRVTKMAETRP